tara:strand:+ start:987 stop:1832 length:846 start_codon:yes stop_codon:yes gene_type:complete
VNFKILYNKIKDHSKLGFINLIVLICKYIYLKIKFRIIFDKNLTLPTPTIKNKRVNYKFYSKEILTRSILLKEKQSKKLNFLDVGGRDGGKTYLLKYYKNYEYNKNYEKDRETFEKQYNYFFQDIASPSSTDSTINKNFILGDICSKNFLQENSKLTEYFDVIYSNNVFEHLKKPWIACSNINKLLKINGICITIVPFSARYHESPVDCFRYTHEGIKYLFEDEMEIEVIACGYDIDGRRNDWNGEGLNNDYVIEDNFGAWRENWTTVLIFKKLSKIRKNN